MALKVIASKTAWDGFTQRAKRAFPKEYIEAIWGEETVDSYRITNFKHIKISGHDSKSVEYDDSEISRQKVLAHASGKVFLGTVHTHPKADYDTAASVDDHHDGASDGEKIMGVVVLYKKKNSNRFVVEVDWWVPQPKITFELLPK